MTSHFDFNSFRSEFRLNRAFRHLVDHLRNARGANNQPLFPTVADQPLPLQDLLNELQIADAIEAADPDFDFEFAGVSIADVRQHCEDHDLDFAEMTLARANKLYYDARYDPEHRNWTEVSRPEASDPVTEMQELIYLDVRNNVVDWRSSLDNLKRLSRDRLYTDTMMHSALIRIVNKFMPDQTQLLKPKTANQIAKFLLRLDSRVDRLSHYRQQLFTLERAPGEELNSALTKVMTLLDKVFPEDVEGNAAHRENILKTAMLSFTPDFIAEPLLEDIKRAAAECTPYSVELLLETVLTAEQSFNVKTAVALKFGRQIGSLSAASHMQFNSMQTFVNQPDFMRRRRPLDYYADPYADQYQYPTYVMPAFDQSFAAHSMPGSSTASSRAETPPNDPQVVQQPQIVQPQDNPFGQLVQRPMLLPHGLPRPQFRPAEVAARPALARPPVVRQTPPSSPAEPVAGPSGLQQRQGANTSNLTQNISDLALQTPMKTQRDSSGDDSTLMRTPAENSVPTIDYNDLDHTVGIVPTMEGPICHRNDIVYRVVNVPLDVLQSPPFRGRPNRSQMEGRATSTPVAPRNQETAPEKAARKPKDYGPHSMSTRSKKDDPPGPQVNSMTLGDIETNYSSFDSRYRPRSPSRDRNRPYSRDRNNYNRPRTPSRDRNRPYSRDRNRSYSRNRDRPYFRDRRQSQSRYPSRDRNRSYSRDRNRPYSRDRNRPYSTDRNRPFSRDRNRPYSRDRNRPYSRDRNSQFYSNRPRTPSRDRNNQPRDRPRGRSPGKRDYSKTNNPRSQSRGKSRERSVESRRLYPEMRKGVNCGLDYNPMKAKHCRKCRLSETHHEFQCYKYEKFNPNLCGVCNKFNHFASDCKEVSSFPPKVSEVNATISNGKN